MARKVDCNVYLDSGREVGVAASKSFTSQATILVALSIWIAHKKELNNLNLRKELVSDLICLPDNSQKYLE